MSDKHVFQIKSPITKDLSDQANDPVHAQAKSPEESKNNHGNCHDNHDCS